ncbi:MAG: hypothetical protein DLD55_03355 [candidate division SR1 bacterium]|nr:MAG: hypothetical protein DLD55_03355 [candidate division SR1 bacterium]
MVGKKQRQNKRSSANGFSKKRKLNAEKGFSLGFLRERKKKKPASNVGISASFARRSGRFFKAVLILYCSFLYLYFRCFTLLIHIEGKEHLLQVQ